VLRFYETPASKLAGSDWRKTPHFRLKKDFIFHLNSSRAASRRRAIALATVRSGELKFKE
jgi:hypothetical protein